MSEQKLREGTWIGDKLHRQMRASAEEFGWTFAEAHRREFVAVVPVQGLDDEKRKLFPVDRFPDWAAVLGHWREALHRVAGEVRDGEAGVRFADEGRLKYCDVLPLLRLPERRRLLAQALIPGVGK